jgi:hypothetical protein
VSATTCGSINGWTVYRIGRFWNACFPDLSVGSDFMSRSSLSSSTRRVLILYMLLCIPMLIKCRVSQADTEDYFLNMST